MTRQNIQVARATPGLANPANESTLEVNVVFTTVEETLPALKKAGELAHGLNATIKLLVTQIVPYPSPLESPPVSSAFTARRFRTMVGCQGVATTVLVILCRQKEQALQDTLAPGTLVVMGVRPRWWRPCEPRLARKLRGLGHEVICVRV